MHTLSSRLAKGLVKAAGMCWINTIGAGKLAGNWVNTRCRATGPPVEVPIATSLYDLRLGAAALDVAAGEAGLGRLAGAGAAPRAAGAAAAGALGGLKVLKRRLLRAMVWTFSHSSALTFSGLR